MWEAVLCSLAGQPLVQLNPNMQLEFLRSATIEITLMRVPAAGPFLDLVLMKNYLILHSGEQS